MVRQDLGRLLLQLSPRLLLLLVFDPQPLHLQRTKILPSSSQNEAKAENLSNSFRLVQSHLFLPPLPDHCWLLLNKQDNAMGLTIIEMFV